MPTFYDPVADAEEAAQALRGLAHASRNFEHPEDAYGVIGDLLAGVRSLQQSVNQLAARHTRHEGRALNDAGDQQAGIRDADLTAAQLSEASTALDAVEERLDNASQAAGRIAWHPANTTPIGAAPTQGEAIGAAAGAAEPVERWVNVVFLQGDEADAVLWLIDRDGPDAAIEHLAGYDYGDETTDAAMENGYVYDTPPASALDRETISGEYTMTHNPDMGHVGLYRRHPIPPEDSLDVATGRPEPITEHHAGNARGARVGAGTAAGAALAAGALGARTTTLPAKQQATASSQGKSWFSRPGVEAVKRDRGISF